MTKNDVDCIIWLKLDRCFLKLSSDVYLCCTYIAPENSPVHALYDFDIFQKLEGEIRFYKTKGDVYLLGDTNARTGSKDDFILNDGLITDNGALSIVTLLPRVSSDTGTNRFGEYLIELCKSLKIRIVNGRVWDDVGVGKLTHTTVKV